MIDDYVNYYTNGSYKEYDHADDYTLFQMIIMKKITTDIMVHMEIQMIMM